MLGLDASRVHLVSHQDSKIGKRETLPGTGNAT